MGATASANTQSGLVIDLDLMRNARHLDRKHSLHEPETLEVLKLIQAHVSALERSALNSEKQADDAGKFHRHEAILVHGPRGSGKTTLLLTVKEALKSGGAGADGWLQGETHDLYKHIRVLPSVDPTLVEGDEVFLATIVANILRECEGARHRSRHRNDDDEDELETALEELAKGFRVLISAEKRRDINEAVSDPVLFAERLLKNARTGLDLARCFHHFCIAACRKLGVKALLQPIDDADVSIDQGWSVLETVRRYLANDQILPLMLGDLRLFNIVVRDAQWSHLKGLAKIARKHGNEQQLKDLEEQVSNLADQYLLKLVRPERRVQLPDALLRLREIGRSERPPQVNSGSQTLELKTLLKLAGALQGRGEDAGYRLLTSNTRELRGVLRLLMDVLPGDNSSPSTDQHHEFIRRYQEVFAGLLALHPEVRQPLSELSQGHLQGWQAWLASRKDPSPYWKLEMPTEGLGEEARFASIVQTLVSVSFVARWRERPLEQAAYFGSVLSPMTAWQEFESQKTYKVDSDKQEGVRPWLDRWRMGSGEPAWLTAARVTVSVIPFRDLFSNRNVLFFGSATRLPPKTNYRKNESLVRVLKELKNTKGHSTGIAPWEKRVREESTKPKWKYKSRLADALFPTLTAWENEEGGADAQLVLNWFRCVPRMYTWRYDLIDPWKGIAMLGDLAMRWQELALEQRGQDALNKILRKFSFDSESLTIAVRRANDEDELAQVRSLDELDESADEAATSTAGFLESIRLWLDSFSKNEHILPPAQWAEVARRFAENLFAINDDLRDVEHSAGKDLERWVLAFLHNLLLVEADIYQLGSSKRGQTLDLRFNIRAYDKAGKIKGPFATNLSRLKTNIENENELPVFKQFATCPLLVATLSEEWRNHLEIGTSSSLRVEFFELDVDIHTALCALVPRFNSSATDKEKSSLPKDSKALEKQVREFFGLEPSAVPTEDEQGSDA